MEVRGESILASIFVSTESYLILVLTLTPPSTIKGQSRGADKMQPSLITSSSEDINEHELTGRAATPRVIFTTFSPSVAWSL